LILLSGRSEREVGIRFTGLREGEKLKEELYYATEEIHPTPFEKIRKIRGPLVGWFQLQRHLNQLRSSLGPESTEGLRQKIKEIVPEYSYVANHDQKGAPRKQIKLIIQERLELNSVPIDGD
jgi:FlaA1/EpsC-like NDP-sugar epimerase